MIYFSGPDENPTGVQGFGTEHNNLVISWKVISSIRLILLILRHLLKSSHTAELDFVIVWSYELSLWGFSLYCHSAKLYFQLPILLHVVHGSFPMENKLH